LDQDNEIVQEFIIESTENLDELDRAFVALEANPGDRERIAAIFRTIHSIKGTSGFLGYSRLESLAHAGEEVLSLLRDGKLPLTPGITTELLAMVDGIRRTLHLIETTNGEGDESFADVIVRLRQIRAGDPARISAAAPPAPLARPSHAASVLVRPSTPAEVLLHHSAPADVVIRKSAAAPAVKPSGPPPAPEAQQRSAPSARPASESRPPHPAERDDHPRTHASDEKHLKHDRTSDKHERGDQSAAADATVRVDVGLLDKLMNLVGELVLARNQILQVGAAGKDAVFVSAAQRLNIITTELQEGVMKTRMRPIGSLWNKFPRVVRDLAIACGKEVRLEMNGTETELDRTILEAIKDPLTHIVRNAVDHGIETAAVRQKNGKSSTGLLTLRAFHEGGKVNIEIGDDGGGIDAERVRAKAIERGLITAERAGQMSEHEIVNLVFEPGFSTTEKVSNISGRGVGMDVVKTNIERIGGSVELTTRVGQSTTLKVKIPLTLAIIPALIVHLGNERYAIPQVNLLELVRLEGEQATSRIEYIHGAPVMRLRGNLLPLVNLRDVLGSDGNDVHQEAVNIVVVQADDRPFGLVVDGVSDTEEIVVKPLGRELKGVTAFAGATIMGDGRVALILDVVGFAQRAGVVSQVRERNHGLASKGTGLDGDRAAADGLLLLEHGTRGRVALPLAFVARLEEFPVSSIEESGGERVVQYRGDILPLITLDDVVGSRGGTPQNDGTLQVVVFSDSGRHVGLVVGRILDIVHETISLKPTGARQGVRGTAVIQGRVTELLDVQAALRAHSQVFS